MKISITDGRKTFTDTMDDSEREAFEECQNNGANPHLEAMTFEEYTRPMCCNAHDIAQFNGNHFIFGWWECFCSSDDVPGWMHEAKSLTIEVTP